MSWIKSIKKTAQAIVFSGVILIIRDVFVTRIFPRVSSMPVFMGYFLSAVTYVLMLLGVLSILYEE